jgi:hypothetical protein
MYHTIFSDLNFFDECECSEDSNGYDECQSGLYFVSTLPVKHKNTVSHWKNELICEISKLGKSDEINKQFVAMLNLPDESDKPLIDELCQLIKNRDGKKTGSDTLFNHVNNIEFIMLTRALIMHASEINCKANFEEDWCLSNSFKLCKMYEKMKVDLDKIILIQEKVQQLFAKFQASSKKDQSSSQNGASFNFSQ